MKPKNSRSTLLINPNFQLRFILATLILLFFTLASIYVTIQYFFCELIDIGIDQNLYHDSEYFKVIANQQMYLSNFLLIIGLVLFIGTIVWGLYFSHRIAGPIYKLNKLFADSNKIEGVKLRPLTFRKDDFFHEVTNNINEYLDQNHLLEKQ